MGVCRGHARRQEQMPKAPDQANCLDDKDEEVEEEAYAIFNVNLPTKKKPSLEPLRVTVLADGRTLELEVDTGASVSIINESGYVQEHIYCGLAARLRILSVVRSRRAMCT